MGTGDRKVIQKLGDMIVEFYAMQMSLMVMTTAWLLIGYIVIKLFSASERIALEFMCCLLYEDEMEGTKQMQWHLS